MTKVSAPRCDQERSGSRAGTSCVLLEATTFSSPGGPTGPRRKKMTPPLPPFPTSCPPCLQAGQVGCPPTLEGLLLASLVACQRPEDLVLAGNATFFCFSSPTTDPISSSCRRRTVLPHESPPSPTSPPPSVAQDVGEPTCELNTPPLSPQKVKSTPKSQVHPTAGGGWLPFTLPLPSP